MSGYVHNHELEDAAHWGNLKLRELLSQCDDDKPTNFVIKDDNIHSALRATARIGCFDAARLLWNRLSPSGKQKYYTSNKRQHSTGIVMSALSTVR